MSLAVHQPSWTRPWVERTGPLTVTVLIDNYNYGRFLRAAVDSALGQTHPDMDVVVVDDGSTDDSRAVLASYGDRVRVLLRENGGQAAAVNAALPMVGGDVVIMLDADDVLEPDTAERAAAVFASQPECVRVQYRLSTVDAEGRRRGGQVPRDRTPLLTGDLRRYVVRYRMFQSPPASGNAYATAAVRALPPAPEDVFRQSVDRWWSDLTALLGPVGALDGTGGRYRVHGENGGGSKGRGLAYFRSRVSLTETAHAAAVRLAAEHDVGGFPRDVLEPLDAAFLVWRMALVKLGDPAPAGLTTGRLALRAAHAIVVQPQQPWRVRAARLLWFVTLSAVPARSLLVSRVIAMRYQRAEYQSLRGTR